MLSLDGIGIGVGAAMVAAYALEPRAPGYTLAFAIACFAASAYAWATGVWPFVVLEATWGGLALHRWSRRHWAVEVEPCPRP